MRNFILFLDVKNKWIQIANTANGDPNDFASFNENLNETENSQYNLTFSIVKQRFDCGKIIWNPIIQYFYIGAKLHLLLDGSKRIDFIIKSIKPTTHKNTSIFEISAQDEFSFLNAKQHVGYNYATRDDSGKIVPKSIFDIAKDVLKDLFLYDWSVVMRSADAALNNYKIVLDITNSNPYNVLIEACNTLNAYMDINYYSKRLDFYRKDLVNFSGYVYYPNSTLTSYNAEQNGDELTTFLHIEGGTDENNMPVTIVPPMPAPVRNFLLDQVDGQVENLNDYIEGIENYTQFWGNVSNNINESHYQIPSNMFLPVQDFFTEFELEEGKIFSLQRQVMTDYSYYTSVDPINNNYFGEISGIFEKKEITIRFYLKNSQGNCIFDTTGEEREEYTVFSNIHIHSVIVDKVALPEKERILQVKLLTQDIITNKSESFRKQKNSCDEFFAVTNKNPTLNVDLFDLSPFVPRMSTEKENELKQLQLKWFHLNLEAQFYSDEYYKALSNLYLLRDKFVSYGENYGAYCQELYEASVDITSKAVTDRIGTNTQNAEEKLKLVIKNSDYLNILKSFGLEYDEDLGDYMPRSGYTISYFEHLIQEKKDLVKTYQDLRDEVISSAQDTSAVTYYDNLIATAENYYTPWIINGQIYPGIYSKIIELIQLYFPEEEELEPGAAYDYERTQVRIKNDIKKPLYIGFRNYIFENTYSNTAELNSISLFNQAYAHFVDLNRIKTSHSLEVLDIGSLEAINIPRLSVGSKILVFNIDSVNASPYYYILGKIAENDNSADWEEQLKTEYENNTGLKLEVDEILSKLYYDELLVTGISRVLREPLKDSITVQQVSRYKTILSKLIKLV